MRRSFLLLRRGKSVACAICDRIDYAAIKGNSSEHLLW